MKEINIKNSVITLVIGLIIWFVPTPDGLSPEAWHLFAIFISTIIGIILKAAPMGTMCMIAVAITAFTQVLAPGNMGDSITLALGGFGNKVIWLIGISFFIARGFIKTGLGNRIAFLFIKIFGKSSLGLAYGLGLADLVLAPVVPSNTARGGGIIYPIMKSMAMSFGSDPDKPETRRKLGSFLTLSSYNANLIASSMFLTGTASNPMCQKFAENLGIHITWTSWAIAAIVPGLAAFFVIPFLLYKIYPPELKKTGDAPKIAAQKLHEMGKISKNEWLMLLTFVILLFLWMTGDLFSIDATTTAFIGLVVLLLTSVLTWDDVKGEKGAWDTIVWFAVLVMMASSLDKLGFINWFSEIVKGSMIGMSWQLAFIIIIAVYFFSHYIFASATAHVAAMYAALLAVGISLGVPGLFLAFMLGFVGSLYGTLTHYGHGPAPVFFGSGYVDLKSWWIKGLITGLTMLVIYLTIGGLWLSLIGYVN
ncbi:anion permease [Flavobacterium sp. ANB]|uniref:anion permease n=1 Tax=unclassified Flavobacterium TaxID=196869 RepID=UPI0012B9E9F1|nr:MULTISPECIES: anion permease [unclassified Flavobacterium]MBF4518838.1 anion permease [Flavobacterium sp. ANB]MTD71449.1 DASS family sodium-coupled anion symporter [Flavobacterium sp. LC2016-13]